MTRTDAGLWQRSVNGPGYAQVIVPGDNDPHPGHVIMFELLRDEFRSIRTATRWTRSPVQPWSEDGGRTLPASPLHQPRSSAGSQHSENVRRARRDMVFRKQEAMAEQQAESIWQSLAQGVSARQSK